jgi:HlyD family secretion protein
MRLPSPSRIALAAAVVVLAMLVLALRGRHAEARYQTAAADRGDVVDVVGATGTLQAVTTVQVGSQVSGNILWLGADFNSMVKKGQLIARLDPSLFEARVAQMRANLTTAVANVERSLAAVEDAKQKYERAKELAAQSLLAQSDLDSAKATYDGALAQLKASHAAVDQARANLNQAQVDLAHTTISTPIDGVVIARNVDIGQTVAASFQAPVLFVIANDMSQMQVNASIDEADIGRVRQGQEVTFRVDAYPERAFTGRVQQVRLQPITNQNVVTYNTIISVANDDLKLMPGMTATVSVIVESRKDVVRIPATALRFRPEGFEDRRGARGEGGVGRRGSRAEGQASPAPAQAEGQSGTAQAEGGRRWRGERADGARGESDAQGGAARAENDQGRPGRPGLVFVLGEDGKPKPTRVRLGISDGRFVEVVEGLEAGATIVTGFEDAAARTGPRPAAAQSTNPFSPGRFQPRSR